MNPYLTDLTNPYLAWMLATATSGLAAYILIIDWKHPANRLVSLLLVIVGINQIAGGFLIRAGDVTQAYFPTVLMGVTTLMTLPVMLLVTLRLLKPEWLNERWKKVLVAHWTAIVLAVLPGILTLLDILFAPLRDFGLKLLYSGLNPGTYVGGFIPFTNTMQGLLAPVLIGINLFTLFIILLVFCLYVVIIDRKSNRSEKILAGMICAVLGILGGLLIVFRNIFLSSAGNLVSFTLIAMLFSYAFFHQMTLEQRPQAGNLQLRLTGLVLSITVPVLVGVVLTVTFLQTTQQVSILIGLAAFLFLVGLIGLTVRQSLYPLKALVETAFSVSEGNSTKEVSVESQDELGLLAESFNRMTRRYKDLNSSLEERVAGRTADLERRRNQLKAAAFVSREAAGIRDVQQMLTQTVQLISSYFDFYHAGIFILDETGEYAVLQAANSEGGQRLLVRGHKLRVGQVGIVGYVADVGAPRIALDVGDDAVFFNNPDLPLTRSEIALPLKARGQVIGVLDVQSIEEAAFTTEDIEILQVMADQVALALDHARLLNESRDALDELRNLYGQRTRQAWRERLARGALSYRYSRTGLISGDDLPIERKRKEDDQQEIVRETVLRAKEGGHELLIPITLRGQIMGSLLLRREKDQKPWSQVELEMATDMIAQVLPALENARLLDEIQNRAQVEKLVSQVSSRIQGSLDLETVLRTAVQEIGLVVNATRVQIRLEKGEEGVTRSDGMLQEGHASVDLPEKS